MASRGAVQKLAEIAAQYLKKGALVFIEGHLQTRKWVGKNGIDRYTTEIVGDELKMLHRLPESKTFTPDQTKHGNSHCLQEPSISI